MMLKRAKLYDQLCCSLQKHAVSPGPQISHTATHKEEYCLRTIFQKNIAEIMDTSFYPYIPPPWS